MKTYTRYFVSQHLGKATAIVEFDEEGHVRIDVPALPERTIAFSFEMARLRKAVDDPACWGETVARVAIEQLHRRMAGKPGRGTASDELDINTARWKGDLREEVYGGATDGYPAGGSH